MGNNIRNARINPRRHFIVIYGYDSKGFKVNDPNCVARSNERWTFSELQYQIKYIWAYKKG